MPVTKVGAIFATQSLLLQRIYIPHGDDSEIGQQHIGNGETIASVPIATYQQGGPVAVQASIGTPAFSGRCALVDKTNMVLGHIRADPVVFGATDPNGNQVIASDISAEGDTWNGTAFTRRYVEINPNAPTALTAIVAVSFQNPATAAPATAGNILIASTTLNVGNAVSAAQLTKWKAQAAAVA